MDDCVSNSNAKKDQDCGGNFNRCSKTSIEFKVGSIETKSFVKSCSTKAVCDLAEDTLKACKAADGKCSLDCCDTDGCNGGTAPVVSVLLMVACALVAFFR